MTETTTTTRPRFTRFELACLLAGNDAPGAARSRELLAIPTVTSAEDPAFIAGRASLAVRGWFGDEGPVATPRNEAGAVAYALANGQRWLSLLLRSGGRTDSAFLVLGDRVSVLGRIAPADAIDFVPVPRAQPAAEMVRKLAAGMLDRDPESALLLKSAGLDSVDVAYIRRHGDAWGISTDIVLPGQDAWPAEDATLQPADREGALDLVRERAAG